MRRMDAAVLVGVFVLAAAPAVSAWREVQERRALVNCASNLRSLWQMQYNYMNQFGGADKLMPTETGEDFWLKLARTKPALIEKLDIYFCPVSGDAIAKDQTSFRGPNGNVNKFDEKDPVGADKVGNHGESKGGNVLLKLGSVRLYAETDGEWKEADAKTTGVARKAPAVPQPAPRITLELAQAAVHIVELQAACHLYRFFFQEWPKELKALVEKPAGAAVWPDGGFLLGGKVPKDPWGNDYVLAAKQSDIEIFSLGSDGRPGGTGHASDFSLRDLDRYSVPGFEPGSIVANQRVAKACLKVLSTAEADFRSNDRDGNLINDFWTGDVYGLFALVPWQSDGSANELKEAFSIKLIERASAEADAAPARDYPSLAKAPPEKTQPRAGYLFRAFTHYQEGEQRLSYQMDTDLKKHKVHHLDRFAFAAYPAEYGKSGTLTFILDQDNTIWSKDTGGKMPETYPASPGAEGWKKAD